MDARITTKVFFNVVVLLVLLLSVDCNFSNERLRRLERQFATNMYEISLLLQRTETIENRILKDSNDESTNSVMYKAFHAEKLQRTQLEDRCEELENQLKQLQKSSRLERQMMDEKINLLRSVQQNVNYSSILQQVEAYRIDIGDIGEEMNTKLEILTNTLDEEAKIKQSEFNNKIADIQDDIYKKLEQYKSNLLKKANISFSAHLGSSIADLKPSHTLRFDRIVTNHGHAYSGTTGIFTAPMDGTYVFYVHILGSTRPLEMNLKKNNNVIMLLYVHGDIHGADGDMVVLELKKGDRIKVVKMVHMDHGHFMCIVGSVLSLGSCFMQIKYLHETDRIFCEMY